MNKSQLKFYTLNNYKLIPQIAGVSKEIIEAIEVVGRVLPFKTNNYVIDELIDWANVETDPMFTLTFPRKDMLKTRYNNTVKNQMEQDADKKD